MTTQCGDANRRKEQSRCSIPALQHACSSIEREEYSSGRNACKHYIREDAQLAITRPRKPADSSDMAVRRRCAGESSSEGGCEAAVMSLHGGWDDGAADSHDVVFALLHACSYHPIIFPACWCGGWVRMIVAAGRTDRWFARYSTKCCISRSCSARPILTPDSSTPSAGMRVERGGEVNGGTEGGGHGRHG